MEEIDFSLLEEKYVAVYDPITGQIKKIGQQWAFEDDENQISIEKEFVESVYSGDIKLFKCFVDFDSSDIKIAEVETINKIDDVLHRITFKDFSDVLDPDIYIVYNKENKKLTIELNKVLGGTKHFSQQKSINRNIIWGGDTEMDFYITSFNDPHILFDIISIKLGDLKNRPYEKNFVKFPDNFSIYTRRLLKNYVCEIS